MDRRNAPAPAASQTEPVFVAAVNINYNDELTPDKLKLEEWPKDKIQPDALRTLDEIKGKRAAHKLFAGEQIVSGKLMGTDGFVSATGKIPKGYRVVSVRVDAVTGASGLILPNDRVDVLVYLARNPGTGITETSTRTILQDVRVFAVDTQFERKHGTDEPSIAAKTVSLLVTPAQAEKVTLATEMGNLRLVMRSPDDSVETEAGGANIKDIFGQGEKIDRTTEEPTPTQPSADTLAWLEKQKQQQAAQTPTPADSPTPDAHHWKMTLLEGSELRQVELNGDDQFPDVITTRIEKSPDSQDDADNSTENTELPQPDTVAGQRPSRD